jgi:hypothetical protein
VFFFKQVLAAIDLGSLSFSRRDSCDLVVRVSLSFVVLCSLLVGDEHCIFAFQGFF